LPVADKFVSYSNGTCARASYCNCTLKEAGEKAEPALILGNLVNNMGRQNQSKCLHYTALYRA